MTMLEQLEKDAKIEKIDIFAISGIIMDAIEVKNSVQKETAIETSETILDSLIDILERMVVNDPDLSKQKKITIIHLINKLKANKEYMQYLKGNLISDKKVLSDMLIASERLGKKSQLAFELD